MAAIALGSRQDEDFAAWCATVDMEGALARLRSQVEEAAVEEARALVRHIAERWPENPRVRHWWEVLQPARIIGVAPPGQPIVDRDRDWMCRHGHEYPGQWVAAYEGRLIAADPSLSLVLRRVPEAVNRRGALICYQPRETE